MYRRWSFVFGIALLVIAAALAIAAPALAGGWVVATLDNLPQQVSASQPVPIGFTLRQHGRTPFVNYNVFVRAEPPRGGENLVVEAKLDDAATGHYSVTLTFPEAGAWRWGISSGLMPEVQWMPDLVVASAAGAPVRAQSRFPLPAALAAAGGLAAILLFALRRSLPAPVRTGSLLVGSALLVGAALLAVAPSLQNQAQAAQPSQPAGAQLGRDLFLAKGCIVCHVNSRAKAASLFSSGGEIPDLSAYHNDPVFLRKWLQDPQAVRPGTGMPNLHLSPAEIDALIAFLNS